MPLLQSIQEHLFPWSISSLGALVLNGHSPGPYSRDRATRAGTLFWEKVGGKKHRLPNCTTPAMFLFPQSYIQQLYSCSESPKYGKMLPHAALTFRCFASKIGNLQPLQALFKVPFMHRCNIHYPIMSLKCFSLATPDVQATTWQAHTFLILLHQPIAEPASTISCKLWKNTLKQARKLRSQRTKPLIPPSGCFTAWCKFFQEVSKPLRTTKL